MCLSCVLKQNHYGTGAAKNRNSAFMIGIVNEQTLSSCFKIFRKARESSVQIIKDPLTFMVENDPKTSFKSNCLLNGSRLK